jgi:GT2 family glycosyltransferase/tetratricopeptide (TPR) repeat protein
MTQKSVTVVIPVWNQWQFTKGCLDSLRPTLGIRDEVIVVDNGSEDFTPQGLKQYPWVKVITNEVNQGFAIACNQGAAAAASDIVIFLNNDTLVPNRWIDGLIAPFSDETVVATGPRSNMVSGPQMVEEADYSHGSMPELKRFAKKWRDDHRGQYDEINRLVGFCLAVRKSAFDAISGFDEGFGTGGAEDDDLCLRLVQNGGRLLIAHESFVHHHGHATFDGNGLDWFAIQEANMERLRSKHFSAQRSSGTPLLSACMITKDEEELLPSCLAALEGLVDEVVIYDTGSTDRTIEIARAAGAKVIEGYWDDDFGRARNASLEHCSGDWILHVDADEIFEGDSKKVRHLLATAQISALQMEILNLSGGGKNDLIHRPCRLFKRKLYHWEGRLHEQVTFRDGVTRSDFGVLPDARLVHSGYTPEMMESRNKAERNIRIAQVDADVEGDGRDPMDKLTNLGRSYTLTGKNEEALELYAKARTYPIESPVTARTLYRAGAQASLAVDRPEDALRWIDELSDASECQDTAHFLRGTTLADMGRWQDALNELEGLSDMRDDDGVVFPIFKAQFARGKCYFGLEQYEKAAEEFAEVAKEDASDEPIWGLVAESFYKTGRDLQHLLKAISPTKINSIFAQIVTATPEAADHVLDALYEDAERRPNVLALAIRIAPNLPAARCLEWSARLRAVGMGDHCPLIARANARATEPVEALRCAALAHATFGDDRALQSIEIVSAMMPVDDFEDAVTMMDGIQPALLGALILSASNTAERCFSIAQKLRDLGAEDQAVAVVLHGRSLPSGGVIADDAATWLESFGRSEEAAVMRSGEV